MHLVGRAPNERSSSRVLSGDAAIPEQQLDGSSRVDGVALGAAGAVGTKWSISANYTYLERRLRRLTMATTRSRVRARRRTCITVTSGQQAALAKRNRQLPEDGAAAKRAGELILDALGRHALFMAAALPVTSFFTRPRACIT